jgi:hypothetical protein
MLRAVVPIESSQLWEDVVSDLEQRFQDPMPNPPAPMEGVEPSNAPTQSANEPVIPAHEPILPLANEPVKKPAEAVKGQELVIGIVNTYSGISALNLAYRASDCQRACV